MSITFDTRHFVESDIFELMDYFRYTFLVASSKALIYHKNKQLPFIICLLYFICDYER